MALVHLGTWYVLSRVFTLLLRTWDLVLDPVVLCVRYFLLVHLGTWYLVLGGTWYFRVMVYGYGSGSRRIQGFAPSTDNKRDSDRFFPER